MNTIPSIDPREFRNALGAFATGVTIITSRAADGTPVGITASSFNSVSLDPPMVLWSLARSALSLPAFEHSAHWAVHVLGAGQEDLAMRFARSGADKFAGLDVGAGAGGAPLLEGCAARFVCATEQIVDGGDHRVFLGRVLQCEHAAQAPLVFHAGGFADLSRRITVKAA